MHATVSSKTVLLLIKFRIRGNMRFLSHAETIRVFQRACARADVKIVHSQGFNPHPKMSLPLPRSVGVESDEELLCLWVQAPQDDFDTEQFKAALAAQLPDGCELIDVIDAPAAAKNCFQPRSADYVLAVQQQYLDEKLQTGIKNLLESQSIELKRRINENGAVRSVDVRPFLKTIEINDKCIIVRCNISPAGSIRIEEILELLGLDYEKLDAPIRRTNVQWE